MAALSLSWFLAVRQTEKPSFESFCAIAKPMPCVEPQTSARGEAGVMLREMNLIFCTNKILYTFAKLRILKLLL
jgi:hypothetical protein